jgi:SAM-dependent methyltransferase
MFCSYKSEPVAASNGRPCSECYATEIVEAILQCPSCNAEYPVIGGIPRFNPDTREEYPEFFQKHAARFRQAPEGSVKDFQAVHNATKRSFGFQWLRYRVTDHQENRDHLYRRTATQPGTLGGQLFFEAGCGMGRYLKVFSDEPGAEVVGLDLSLAVNRAHAENKANPLVHVVQGNIMKLPFRPGTFDHAYSIGVLHHTPSTEQAFHSIAKLVKPGGRVSIWVYHVWCPPGLRGFAAMHAKLKGAVTDALRVITTRMPHKALHYLCYLAIPWGWVQARIWEAPKPVKALFSPLLLVHMSIHEKPEIRLLDTFDWYSPQYQWKHTVKEVEGWFREEGLVDIDSHGFEVSVRGRRPE